MKLALYLLLVAIPVLGSCVACSTIMCHVANHEYGPGQTAYPCEHR